MSGNGFSWHVPPETAFTGLYDGWGMQIVGAVYGVCQAVAPEAENWMKQSAPWMDRTGNARQSLHVKTEIDLPMIRLVLDHGMWYGVFLEFANAGRYAVVGPAVDVFTPRVFGALQGIFT